MVLVFRVRGVEDGVEMRRGRGHGPADGDGGNVPGALELEHQGVVEGGAGDGGEAEAGLGGVLEVGAAVGEVDEGHFGEWVDGRGEAS